MLGPDALPAFLLTALLIELTPGPNMAYLAIVAGAEGRRAGLAAVAGVALGLAIIGGIAAFGVAALLSASPAAFAALRWGGTFYLLYLAVEAWMSAREVSPGKARPPGGVSRHFGRGLIVNLLNPKAFLFYVAVLPRFIPAGYEVEPGAVWLTIAYVALATAIHLVIVLGAARLQPWLTSEHRQQTARRVFAVLLAGVAIWFLATSG